MTNKFDDALSLVGGFGPSQYWLSFSSIIIHAYCGWPSLITVFVALQVPFECLDRGKNSSTYSHDTTLAYPNVTSNGTPHGVGNAYLEVMDQFDDQCYEKCLNYGYLSTPSSIVSTFDLACGSGPTLVSLANSSFWFAFLVSCFIIGPLSDKFGRRRIFLPLSFVYFAVTLTLSFVQNIYQFIIVRFFCGFFHYPTLALPYIITMEMISQNKRAFVGMITTTCFSLGCISCALVAFYFKNSWRMQIVAMALSQLPLIVVSYFKLTESGRWLLQKSKHDRLERQLLRSAKGNGKPVTLMDIKACLQSHSSGQSESQLSEKEEEPEPDEFLDTDQLICQCNDENRSENDSAKSDLRPKFMDLFRTFKSSFLCITNVLAWLAVSMVYYGLTFGVDILPGNVYVNSVLLSLIEFPGIFTIFAVDKFGRKYVLTIFFLTSAVACLGLPVAKKFSRHVIWPLSLAMLGKLLMGSAFGLIYFYTPEQMPTSLRTTGMSVCSAFARIGTIVAPFVIQLHYLSPYAPYCVFAGSGFIASVLCVLFAVETRNKPLPQTLSDFYKLVDGKTV